MSKDDEMILVVPTNLLHKIGIFQGFTTNHQKYLPRLLNPDVLEFRRRGDMEKDPSYKQLIPYCLLQCRDMLFQYTRKGQSEQRLEAMRSIGIGGHVSEADAAETPGEPDSGPYLRGLSREFAEELILPTGVSGGDCIGLLNDDSAEVHSVHLGIVHLFRCKNPDVTPRENTLVDAGFRPIAEILQDADKFENWSQLCLQGIYNVKDPMLPAGAGLDPLHSLKSSAP